MAQLPYQPLRGSSRSVTPRFLRADLGDGYDQRSGDGIQTIKEEWSVIFAPMDQTSANTLVAFFEGLEGYQKFEWIPFRQTTEKKFICTNFTENYAGDSLTQVQATFRQVFDRS